MCPLAHTLTTGLTGDSGYLQLTFKRVVEHIHEMALASAGCRRRYARTALEILLQLARKTTFPLVDVACMNRLLESGAGKINNDVFILFLRLRALRKEEDGAADVDPQFDQDTQDRGLHPQFLGEAVTSATPTVEHTLKAISDSIKTCRDREGGWQDEAVYGGLIAIRDIPQLRTCTPDVVFLETLAKAMEKDKPFSVRKAAYDVIQAAQYGWLRSMDLRQILEDHDFPRRLHSVVIETGRDDHQLSFLKMMEILSEDRHWHPYLRGAMDLWLDFRHEGSQQVIQILLRVGEIPPPPPPEVAHNLPLDNYLVKIVEDEWERVPGRPAMDLSIDLLEPFAEVTTRLKELLFTETDRRAVVTVVERVVSFLEMRRDGGYEVPGNDIIGLINGLLEVLRKSPTSTSRKSSYWHTM